MKRFGGKWAVTANGYWVSFWGDENVVTVTVVIVALFCE